MSRKYLIPMLAFVVIAFMLAGCAALKNIQQSVTNLQRCEFKLESVNNFAISGIRIEDKKKLDDFSLIEGARLTQNFAQKRLPASFILNLGVKNPNDGKGDTKSTDARLTNMDWELYIDNVETISGSFDKEVIIPGTGREVTIPLKMELDLYNFFANRSYENLVNLALNIGGVGGSPSKITLYVRPIISTPFGLMNNLGRIKVVDKEWRNGQ
ncbi:MAG: hypothetical protein ACLFQX_04890 [Candidatus Kapaibacterium sp.]